MIRFLETDDTICATATPPGRGGIAVIRLSGSDALKIARRVAPFLPEKNKIKSHRAYFGRICSIDSQQLIDEALVTFFKNGSSFTGQEVVEFSVHGSPAICEWLLRELIGAGARIADKGEFTYRAFCSGKIDLVQAESILSVIESTSSSAATRAARSLSGELSKKLSFIENEITLTLANLEANIDFSQEDIEIETNNNIVRRLDAVRAEVASLISAYKYGRLIREGLNISLIGIPNAGKSSLLNALLCFDKAIVSDQPGTTRDLVQGEFQVRGLSICVHDTAGLRDTNDSIELAGLAKTQQSAQAADLLLFVFDATANKEIQMNCLNSFREQMPKKPVFLVINKCDLSKEVALNNDLDLPALSVSAKEGLGIENLKTAIYETFFFGLDENSDVSTTARQNEALILSEQALVQAIDKIKKNDSPEFIISDLQEALLKIYEILGKRFDDQVMDRVFSEFCLGK